MNIPKPSSKVPFTLVPITEVPTTQVPSTVEPTTQVPTTQAPTYIPSHSVSPLLYILLQLHQPLKLQLVLLRINQQ